MTTQEDLIEVRNTLGRMYQRIPSPSKTEGERYNRASLILNKAIEALDRLARTGKRAPEVEQRLAIAEALDSMTIEEIKREVGSGNLSAKDAIMLEESGKGRSTLLAWLRDQQTN